MSETIKGTFKIKSSPLEKDKAIQKLGGLRMLFEKEFEGALQAKSIVSMLGVMNEEVGSGGYVAIEIIEGTVGALNGSFGMQHSSFMKNGKSEQLINIIPGTGTGELCNISGSMVIDIKDGQHFYTFEYSL